MAQEETKAAEKAQETKAAEKDTAKVSTKKFYDKKMEEVKAGKKVVLNLTDKVKVKFVKDTKHIKSGDKVYTISQSAFETYNLNGKVVEKVN